jgi:uncharacterized protein (UPF0261 family)
MPKYIAVIASLDTKGDVVAVLKEHIERFECVPILLDTSMMGEPGLTADISAADVALAGGHDLSELRASTDTDWASSVMIAGGIVKLKELLAAGRLDGTLSVGGHSGTVVGTSMMKALPFGVPKFMVSSSASMPYGPLYIDTKDITLMHSVVDLVGLNELSHAILVRAAGGVCGMAKASDGPLKTTVHERPLIAVTEFKFAERCVKWVLDGLPDHGYDVIVWHANGTGDRAMDELIEQGLYDGVIDVVPAGVSEFMFGGNRAAGPHRLEAAGRVGIPQVIAPSGFDMLSCGPLERRDNGDQLWASRGLADRAIFIPDAMRVQVRTTADELTELAGVLAQKLNASTGPVTLVFPTDGWSNIGSVGQPLYDPATDAILVAELRKVLRPEIKIVEVDTALNTPEFAAALLDELDLLMAAR